MQPHAEFVKGEREADAVQGSYGSEVRFGGRCEQEVRAQPREQEDAVVEMVNVGAAEVKVQVRQAASHYEKGENAGSKKCQNKGEQGAPGQAPTRRLGSVRGLPWSHPAFRGSAFHWGLPMLAS